jgi:phosphohistidine phosphatase
MDLFLVRHAIAEDGSPDGSDATRALTRRGRKRFSRSVRGLERLGMRFDRVWFSPLLRAQETAEELLDLCDEDYGCETQVVLELAMPPGPELLAIIANSGVERLALVGHEPWLSQLTAWLACGWRVWDEGDAGCVVDLAKGGVIHLSGEAVPGSMALVAAYPPAVLLELARR